MLKQCPSKGNKYVIDEELQHTDHLFLGVGTNCAPLLADLFLYSYESEFLQKLVKDKKIHEARAFNFTYRYIDDVLSINNSRFANSDSYEYKNKSARRGAQFVPIGMPTTC
jgi:hypothetical protein